ncbi:MAG: hypothetical protein D6737_16655 [Chloroflexi bacterium]|nr:MAG: hypothetical protein D6737_16655 [Chloroflexota bacterium]
MFTSIHHIAHEKKLKWALYNGAIILAFSLVLVLVALQDAQNGALDFAHIGTIFSEQDANGTKGYDGQFVYYIARDGAAAVPLIDGPSLRYQRILYPILGHVVSFGQAAIVPWALIAINVIAHSTTTALITYSLIKLNAPTWGGLIYGFWFGALTAVLFDLNEPLTFALAMGAVIAYQHGRLRITIVLLILATLAKELALLIAAGLALHAFVAGKRHWAVLIAGGPALMFFSWWGVMRVWFGTLPTRYPAARFQVIPFGGLAFEDNPIELFLLAAWLILPTIVLSVVGIRYLYTRRQLPLSLALLIPATGFIMIMPGVVWEDPVAAYRISIPIIITGLLFVGQCHPKRMLWLGGLWLPGLMLFILGRDIFL